MGTAALAACGRTGDFTMLLGRSFAASIIHCARIGGSDNVLSLGIALMEPLRHALGNRVDMLTDLLLSRGGIARTEGLDQSVVPVGNIGEIGVLGIDDLAREESDLIRHTSPGRQEPLMAGRSTHS